MKSLDDIRQANDDLFCTWSWKGGHIFLTGCDELIVEFEPHSSWAFCPLCGRRLATGEDGCYGE